MPRPRLRLVLEFLLYTALTVLMLHATWLTWPDAYIDFSRELYLPWRVSCGDVLYRDLAYYFGPVSVYTNAALFALLGRPSIHALFALNFVFWIATLLALRLLLRRIASPLAGTLAVSSFILLFSFNRCISCGNFNYLAPYSHELARGFLFSLLALLSLDSALAPSPMSNLAPDGKISLPSPSAFRFLLPGFFLALVLFAKPELALAASASLALLFALHAWQRRTLLLRPLLACAFAALFTIALVVAPFAFAFHSFAQALRHALLKLYLDCFNPSLTNLPFFKTVLGTDTPFLHAAWLLLGICSAAAPFPAAGLLLPRLRSNGARRVAAALLALLAAAVGFFAFAPLNAALVLAPMAFGLCGETRKNPLAAAFALFSFLLVSKMLLNASVTFYGFVLALPAFCCALLWAFRLPCPPVRVLLAGALLLGFSGAALRLQSSVIRQWDIAHPVHDSAYLAPRHEANAFRDALDWIRVNTPPGSTLAVLPEGAILNVLSERPNPTPYVSIPDTDWPRYGEAAVLAAYSNAPPDTLVLVRKPQYAEFGTGYAQSLMALLDPLYAPAHVFALPSPSGPVPWLIVATRVPAP